MYRKLPNISTGRGAYIWNDLNISEYSGLIHGGLILEWEYIYSEVYDNCIIESEMKVLPKSILITSFISKSPIYCSFFTFCRSQEKYFKT